jgi:pyruvate, water dikinase
MNFPEPMPAFDTITAEIPYSAIGANTARLFVFPATLGIEHRIVNGRVYITAIPVTDPEEIGRRAVPVAEAVSAGYGELGAAVAVRSSATLEDSAGASFAGRRT